MRSGFLRMSHFRTENRFPPRIKSGAGFFLDMLCRFAAAQHTDAFHKSRGRALGTRHRGGVLPDDLDLPGNILLVEATQTSARAKETGCSLGADRDAVRIANLVAVARRYEIRHVQLQRGSPLGGLQPPQHAAAVLPIRPRRDEIRLLAPSHALVDS